MSTTMDCVHDLRNAEQSRLSVSDASVQSGTARLTSTAHGFVVLDKAGEFIAWALDISTAKDRCDGDPLARTVERCADGATMCWKAGKSWARK